ncbi:MAG TPA: DUF4337 family protein [Polyangiaceae bacterium]|jgi:hypothetical protein
MAEAHEIAERIEEAAHHEGGHGGGHSGIGKFVGLTMAVIGVLLAVCSAYVGSERTELVKTMVEQSNTYSEYQASSTKYRAMMAQIQQTYAVTPSRRFAAEALERLEQMPVPKEAEELAALDRATLKELTQLMTPRKSEVEGFLGTIARYDEERKAAREWAESYEDEVNAHFEGSEDFEKAQLLAEIGIVIASIALLRSSRPFWYVSIVAALVCAVLVGKTWMSLRHEVHEAEEKQAHARQHYEQLRGAKDASGKRAAEVRDDETLAKIRERFAITSGPPEREHP